MIKTLLTSIRTIICTVLIFQLVGCGTLMYPERKGQKGGKIDTGVALLDGIGLLFFLIPGIIAFAIDFNNGTIYLPGTHFTSLKMDEIKQVKFDSKQTDLAGIEKIIKEQTGYTVKLDQANLKITKVKTANDLVKQFKQVFDSTQDNRLALVRS